MFLHIGLDEGEWEFENVGPGSEEWFGDVCGACAVDEGGEVDEAFVGGRGGYIEGKSDHEHLVEGENARTWNGRTFRIRRLGSRLRGNVR